MSEPIEAAYFNWLRAKVLDATDRNYDELLRILYTTEFVWVVERDSNRAEDGVELRDYFGNETQWDLSPYRGWYEEPCSLLEFFIALADRASFQTGISIREWFWIFMTNLGLDEYRRISRSDKPDIEEILQRFMLREYDHNGRGGIFPVSTSPNDQREVENWYQFCEYVDDQGLF